MRAIIINLSEQGVKAGDKCLIAVKADNSDDKNYPPGKPQTQLDFSYHGGMYRDVWLIGQSSLHLTDAVEQNEVAGGGVFLHFDNISEKSADVLIDVEVCKEDDSSITPLITARIKDATGKTVKTAMSVDAEISRADSHRDTCHPYRQAPPLVARRPLPLQR